MSISERSLKRVHYLLLAISVLVCCIPFMTYYVTSGHDTGYLLFRLEGIARGLAAGEFPPRIQTSQLHGYGYPASVTFPDLFIYPVALLRALGLSLNNTYRLLLVCVNVVTAVVSYESLRRISGRNIALIATLIWMFAPYRNEDVLLRADFGEAIALSFLPLFSLGVYRIIREPERNHPNQKWRAEGWFLCGIAMSGVVYSNLCVTVIMMVFVIPICIALAIANRRLLVLAKDALKAATLALLLTAAFIVPLVDYHMNANLAYKNGFGSMTREHMETNALHPAHLFLSFVPFSGFSACDRQDQIGFGCMPLSIGWTLLGCGVCALLVLAIPEVRDRIGRRVRLSLTVLLVSVTLLMVTCTKLFPWDGDVGLLNPFISLLTNLQFPWRLLGPISFLLVLCLVFVAHIIGESAPAMLLRVMGAAFVALALFECGFAVTTFLYYCQSINADEVLANDSGVYDAQFVPAGTDLSNWQEGFTGEPVPFGEVDVTGFSRHGSKVALTVRTRGGEEAYIDLPLLLYRYVSIISTTPGRPACTLREGDNGVARLMVPAGYEGKIEVGFVEPLFWRIAEAVSFLTLCIVAVVTIRSKVECNRDVTE